MTDKQKRVLEIGNHLMTWSLGFLKLLQQVGKVEKMPDISDIDKQLLRMCNNCLNK
jgi:hypothetical protein